MTDSVTVIYVYPRYPDQTTKIGPDEVLDECSDCGAEIVRPRNAFPGPGRYHIECRHCAAMRAEQ